MKHFLVLFISSLTLGASLAVVPSNPTRDSFLGKEVVYATIKGFTLPVDTVTTEFIQTEIRAAAKEKAIHVWPSPTDPMAAELVSTSDAVLDILNSHQAVIEVLSSDQMFVEGVVRVILH
jgi:hypothetical protein